MKTILGTMLGVAITVSPQLAGQEPVPATEKQKQEAPKKQPPANQQQEPQTPEKPKPKPEKPLQPPAVPPKQQKPDDKEQQPQQDKQKQKQSREEAKKTKENKQPGQNSQQNNRTQHSTQGSHGKGKQIPPEKFQSNFGSQHHFRMQHLEDGRRFQHGGYWFELVEVWPADWSYDDACYIDEDAGDYYVVDLYHPGIRVSVIVVEG